MRSIRGPVAVAVVVIMAGGALAACTSSTSTTSSAVATYVQGVSSGVHVPPPVGTVPAAFATWAGSDQLYVVTYGSGSCPSLPTEVRAQGQHRVEITTRPHKPKGTNACTADLGPSTSTVTIPASIDLNAAITVEVDGTTLTVEPR